MTFERFNRRTGHLLQEIPRRQWSTIYSGGTGKPCPKQ